MGDPVDDVEAWGIAQRRRAGLRLLGVGLLMLIPSAIWLAANPDWESRVLMRIQVVAAVAVAIGGLLALAGTFTIVRARRRPGDPPIPVATAKDKAR